VPKFLPLRLRLGSLDEPFETTNVDTDRLLEYSRILGGSLRFMRGSSAFKPGVQVTRMARGVLMPRHRLRFQASPV
jgi:hypothetical protein